MTQREAEVKSAPPPPDGSNATATASNMPPKAKDNDDAQQHQNAADKPSSNAVKSTGQADSSAAVAAASSTSSSVTSATSQLSRQAKRRDGSACAGLILYTRDKQSPEHAIRFLVLRGQGSTGHWIAPQAERLPTENHLSCALRVTRAMTQISSDQLRIDTKFKYELTFLDGAGHPKGVSYFLACVPSSALLQKESDEKHIETRWIALEQQDEAEEDQLDTNTYSMLHYALEHLQKHHHHHHQEEQQQVQHGSPASEDGSATVEEVLDSSSLVLTASATTSPLSMPASPVALCKEAPTPPSTPRQPHIKDKETDPSAANATNSSSIAHPLNPLYKTVLCAHFQRDGTCRNGVYCHYAHGEEELNQSPFHKIKLCESFMQRGQCAQGTSCSFAHGLQELKKWGWEEGKASPLASPLTTAAAAALLEQMQSPIMAASAFSTNNTTNQAGECGDVDPEKFKTRLCRHFFLRGRCEFGDHCQFAHGHHELRPRTDGSSPQKENNVPSIKDKEDEAKEEEKKDASAAAAAAQKAEEEKKKEQLDTDMMCRPYALYERDTVLASDAQNMVDDDIDDDIDDDATTMDDDFIPRMNLASNSRYISPQEQNQRMQQQQLQMNLQQQMQPSHHHQQHHQHQHVVSGSGSAAPIKAGELPVEQLFKTKLCRHYKRKGFCPLGSNCKFAHGDHELRIRPPNPPVDGILLQDDLSNQAAPPTPTPTTQAVAAQGAMMMESDMMQNVTNNGLRVPATEVLPNGVLVPVIQRPELFKTKLCKHFARNSVCPLGVTCGFAHGLHELRNRIGQGDDYDDAATPSHPSLRSPMQQQQQQQQQGRLLQSQQSQQQRPRSPMYGYVSPGGAAVDEGNMYATAYDASPYATPAYAHHPAYANAAAMMQHPYPPPPPPSPHHAMHMHYQQQQQLQNQQQQAAQRHYMMGTPMHVTPPTPPSSPPPPPPSATTATAATPAIVSTTGAAIAGGAGAGGRQVHPGTGMLMHPHGEQWLRNLWPTSDHHHPRIVTTTIDDANASDSDDSDHHAKMNAAPTKQPKSSVPHTATAAQGKMVQKNQAFRRLQAQEDAADRASEASSEEYALVPQRLPSLQRQKSVSYNDLSAYGSSKLQEEPLNPLQHHVMREERAREEMQKQQHPDCQQCVWGMRLHNHDHDASPQQSQQQSQQQQRPFRGSFSRRDGSRSMSLEREMRAHHQGNTSTSTTSTTAATGGVSLKEVPNGFPSLTALKPYANALDRLRQLEYAPSEGSITSEGTEERQEMQRVVEGVSKLIM